MTTKKDLRAIVNEVNRFLKEGGKVQLGEDIDYLEWERMSSGSLGLDIAMGGGLPRGCIVQYKGPESSGKTTMAVHACAVAQARGENVAWGAIEPFAKQWARTNGCFIPFSKKEVKKLGLSPEEVREYHQSHEGYGEFLVARTYSSMDNLEACARLTRSCAFSIVVVDSLGVIMSPEDEDKDVGQDTRVTGAAKPITHFMKKLISALNKKDPNTEKRNQTCVILINQLRDQVGVWSPSGKPPPEAGGGWALKHNKDIDIRFSKGERMMMVSRKRRICYGLEVKAVTDKNKTSAPHVSVSWKLYFRDCEKFDVEAGMVDLAEEVMRHGIYYGLIEVKGSWYYVGEDGFQGKDNLLQYLRGEPEVVEGLRGDILETAINS